MKDEMNSWSNDNEQKKNIVNTQECLPQEIVQNNKRVHKKKVNNTSSYEIVLPSTTEEDRNYIDNLDQVKMLILNSLI